MSFGLEDETYLMTIDAAWWVPISQASTWQTLSILKYADDAMQLTVVQVTGIHEEKVNILFLLHRTRLAKSAEWIKRTYQGKFLHVGHEGSKFTEVTTKTNWSVYRRGRRDGGNTNL